MKEYIKPELEIISLMSEEEITSKDDLTGELDLSTNPFNN